MCNSARVAAARVHDEVVDFRWAYRRFNLGPFVVTRSRSPPRYNDIIETRKSSLRYACITYHISLRSLVERICWSPPKYLTRWKPNSHGEHLNLHLGRSTVLRLTRVSVPSPKFAILPGLFGRMERRVSMARSIVAKHRYVRVYAAGYAKRLADTERRNTGTARAEYRSRRSARLAIFESASLMRESRLTDLFMDNLVNQERAVVQPGRDLLSHVCRLAHLHRNPARYRDRTRNPPRIGNNERILGTSFAQRRRAKDPGIVADYRRANEPSD